MAGAARREYALVAMALGAIAVHLVGDNLLQPQPGTSDGDHIVTGLVPIAVLALAAIAYSAGRPAWVESVEEYSRAEGTISVSWVVSGAYGKCARQGEHSSANQSHLGRL